MIPYQSNPFQLKIQNLSEQRWPWLLLGGLFIIALLVIILVILLLLPPFSLLSRLDRSYVSVGMAGNTLRDPDGAQLIFLPEGVAEPFRVKLAQVPRNLFLEGSIDPNLLNAASTIPANLVMKSPFYRIERRGPAPRSVTIDIPIPNEAEPYHTLDLYTWDGESWVWLPSRTLPDEEVIEATLSYLPTSVVVMQTHPLNPHVSAAYSPNTLLPDDFRNAPLEINPQGYYLEAEGLIAGKIDPLPSDVLNGAFTIMPTIRNWNDEGVIRSDLIDNLLIDPEARQRHIATIVGLLQSNTYGGIELDYRGISPDLRDDFTSLLKELRTVLPLERRLAVRVELPQPLSGETWDTGPYDWQAIGSLADFVRMPASPDPRAYAPGGQMNRMLDWAVGQVNRYKLQLSLTTRSVEQHSGQTRLVNYHEALTALGTVAIAGGASTIRPGQPLDFSLSGLQNGATLQFDSDSGLYLLTQVKDNTPRALYLENAASLARKLQLVAQYNLRGVAVQNLFDDDSDFENRAVIRHFIDLALSPTEGQHAVVWQVKNQDGGIIAEEIDDLTASPAFRWTTPAASGNYQVTASISPNRNPATATPLGSVAIVVTGP
ncbi:MAG: hypothetical protein U0401_01320 [Anaerolineae bacterium]